MAKPRLIILIRHAQSEGNKNREIHQTIPDHRVKLTQDGWQQAYDAGRRLRKLLRPDDTLHFFTSPYRRTRETTEGILSTLTAEDPEPSPFQRESIKVYEEPRLREQDFGNFQPCSAEMERMWQERADYGHFFYRIPNGESAADAYDRVSGFNESLWRQFGDDDFASVCVLVTHGLMSRVFLMKWYHFSVEYFEDLRNVNHCEFLIMRKQDDSGKYLLENKLRTWTELRRERALLKEKEREANGAAASSPAGSTGLNGGSVSSSSGVGGGGGGGVKDKSKLDKAAVLPRRWGGCPNGCNHDKSFRIRSALADLVKRDGTAIYPSPPHPNNPTTRLADARSSGSGSGSGSDSCSGSAPGSGFSSEPDSAHSTPSLAASSLASRRPAARRFQSPAVDGASSSGGFNTATPLIDITRAQDEVVSSPDGTPSFISAHDRLGAFPKSPPAPLLHVGRDFGGTYSGHTSEADSSEDEATRSRMARLKLDGGSNSLPQAAMSRLQSLPLPQHPDSANGCAKTVAEVAESDDEAESSSEPGATTDSLSKSRGINGAANGDSGKATPAGGANGHKRDRSGMGRGTFANRLGDAPHCDHHHHDHDHSEPEHEHAERSGQDSDGSRQDAAEDDDLAAAEREDKSIAGSVY